MSWTPDELLRVHQWRDLAPGIDKETQSDLHIQEMDKELICEVAYQLLRRLTRPGICNLLEVLGDSTFSNHVHELHQILENTEWGDTE